MRKTVFTFLCLISWFQLNPAWAESYESELPGNRYVKVELVSDKTVAQPSAEDGDSPLRIGLHFTIEPGWHIYWKNSGDAGAPTKVTWDLPAEWEAKELSWPVPLRIEEPGNISTFGYEHEVLLSAPLVTPTIEPIDDENVTLGAEVSWLVCADICVPGKTTVSKTIPFSINLPLEPTKEFKLFTHFDRLTPSSTAKLPFDVKLEASVSQIKPGQSFDLVLTLSGLKQFENPSSLFQFFPLPPEGFHIGKPYVVYSDEAETIITASVATEQHLKPGDVSLGGILSASSQLSVKNEPIAIELGTLVSISNTDTVQNSSTAQLAEKAKQRNVLSMRLLDKSVRAEGSGVEETATMDSDFWITFAIALFSGFIAGMILNLMPCVLPIISIKVMGFLNCADTPRSEIIRSAWAFAAGILFTFLCLALTVIGLQNVGLHVGWGFQFQQPVFVFALFLIVFVLSLVFFDVYSFQLPYLNSANKKVSKMSSGLGKHFFEGMLVTALSTPCTAPFLGTALAFAFAQPAFVTITVFLAIGCGLALPYAYLTTHPKLLKFLPKPGPWEYRVKEFLGFLLLATAAWLLFVMHRLTEEGAVWSVSVAIALFFCIWAGKWTKDSKSSAIFKFASNALLFIFFASMLSFSWPMLLAPKNEGPRISSSAHIDWKPFSERTISMAQDSGQIVFVDFTAAWCVTCKVNETLVIETESTGALFRNNDVLTLKADWTDGDPSITRSLNRFGSQGVPLYVFISPDRSKKPIILPTVLTPSSIAEGLAEAKL